MITGSARLATPEDASVVGQLLDAFNTEYDEPSPGPAFLTRRLRRLLDSPQAFGVVAGSPIHSFGLVTLRPSWWDDGSVAVLDELYTEPAVRGQGLGSEVLATVVAEAARRGATATVIEVDEPDHDAHRFYARHGFVAGPVGHRALILRRAE